MYDDDKGRGSYKCGRCGVPKKGHVCPYQPKVKRRPEDPAPEMKCVSTQVEMDEFMTLRRLNLEIQGFPESYAAEPMDMVGAEVHSHPPSVLVSGATSYSASASRPPPSHRGPEQGQHLGGVPSLASMNSHPSSYPQAASYPPPSSMPPSVSEMKTNESTKLEPSSSAPETSKPEAKAAKPSDSEDVETTTQNDTTTDLKEEAASPIKSEEKTESDNTKNDGKPKSAEESTEANKEEESDSNKRIKVG